MAVTWNSADKNANIVLSNNDLTADSNVTGWKSVRATEAKSSGKWYFEAAMVFVSAAGIGVGVMQSGHSLSAFVGSASTGWGFLGNPFKTNNGFTTYGVAPVTNDILMCAVDMDSHKIWWGKNGTWFESGDPAAGTNAAFTNLSGSLYPACSLYTAEGIFGETITARFKDSSFSYVPPTGFSAWEELKVELPRLIQTPQAHNSFVTSRLGL